MYSIRERKSPIFQHSSLTMTDDSPLSTAGIIGIVTFVFAIAAALYARYI